MAHKSQEQLLADLVDAEKKVRIGCEYSHYKNPAYAYEVTGFAIMESTDEPAVVYQALYGKRITYVRPLSSWMEQVDFNGARVPRFSLKNNQV